MLYFVHQINIVSFRCQEPDDLVEVQSLSWDPIINWVNKHYQIKPVITDSMTSLAKLSPLDKEKLTRYFNSYNIWGLTGKLSMMSIIS